MTKASLYIGMFLCAFGAFYIIGAVTNWDAFMRAKQARTITGALGRKGARYFYVAMGTLMCAIGTLLALFGFPGTTI